MANRTATGPIVWKVTPEEFVRTQNWESRRRGQEIEVKSCPYCAGGRSKDTWKFAINATTGQFKCMKGSCPASAGGGFWDLIEAAGLNPVEFIDRSDKQGRRQSTQKKEAHTMSMNNFRKDNNFDHHNPNPGAHITGAQEKKDFKPPYTPAHELSAAATSYLHGRGLSDATLTVWCVASNPGGDILFRYFEARAADGQPAGHVFSKQRFLDPAAPSKTIRDAGGKAILYGTWLCDPQVSKTLTIVVGELDAITISQAGVPNIVSLPSGDNDHNFVDLQWKWLAQWERIVLWMDADQSGQRALHILAMRLKRTRCFQVETPYKDANALLTERTKTHDADDAMAVIRQTIEDAIPYQHELLVDVADAMEAGDRAAQEEPEPVSLTRWGAIDAATKGFHAGDTYLVFGAAGSGKSTVVANLACERIEAGGNVLLYSGEMSLNQCGRWIEGILAGPQYTVSETDSASGAVDHKPDPRALPAIRQWYRGHLSFYKVFGAIDPDAFFDACEYAVRRFKVDTIVIDSLTTAFPPGTDDLYQVQGEFAWRARHFAEEFGVTIFLLMHTTAASDRDGAEEKPPTLGAMRGAKVCQDAATHVLGVWRVPVEIRTRVPSGKKPNRYYESHNVIVLLKNRDRGEQAQVRMCFDARSKRFSQQATPDHATRQFRWVETLTGVAPPLTDKATPAYREWRMHHAMETRTGYQDIDAAVDKGQVTPYQCDLPDHACQWAPKRQEAPAPPPAPEPILETDAPAQPEPGSVESLQAIDAMRKASGELRPSVPMPDTFIGEIPF